MCFKISVVLGASLAVFIIFLSIVYVGAADRPRLDNMMRTFFASGKTADKAPRIISSEEKNIKPIKSVWRVATGPSVMKENDAYKMWFMLIGKEKHGIGYATSSDGIWWSPYPENPVFAVGLSDEWDGEELGTAEVLKENDTYVMWYRGNSGKLQQVGRATSKDGIRWMRDFINPVLNVSGNEWDSTAVVDSFILFDQGVYKAWYRGSVDYDQAPSSIGFAVSADGKRWIKYKGNPVIRPGLQGAWDDKLVGDQTILKERNEYKMWYAGTSYLQEQKEDEWWNRLPWPTREGWKKEIGFATSLDGIVWKKYQRNPVVRVGGNGEWDSIKADNPFVMFDEGMYKMWYRGQNLSYSAIGYATSSDGIQWTKYSENPILKAQ
ncbi:MAG: hypothetical protein AAB819_01935 [Patescibacteria group bacterium]